MTDLDIDIDIPDDDDLDAPPPVLDNGDQQRLWPKLAGALAVVVAAIVVYGYLNSPDPKPTAQPEPTTAPVPTTQAAEPAPAVEFEPEESRALDAILAWERFAASADLGDLNGTFATDGPQYSLFERQAADPAEGPVLRFEADNISLARGDSFVTVSTDLTVTDPDGSAVAYPYDLVFLTDSPAVWTVVDRRAPGTPALPPSAPIIDAAQETFDALGEALSLGNDTAVHLTAPGDAPEFTETHIAAITDGRLHTWTQLTETQVIATLEVDGTDVATVTFANSDGQWLFDHPAAGGLGSTP